MFAYGLNNPVRFVDRDGEMAAEGVIAATNWWNPVGWASAALFVVEVIGLVVTISLVDELLDNPPVVFESEHTKNKRPSTKGKHEKGQTRKKRDQGGEKKEQKKGWVPNRNKRNSINNTGRMRAWKNDRIVHVLF